MPDWAVPEGCVLDAEPVCAVLDRVPDSEPDAVADWLLVLALGNVERVPAWLADELPMPAEVEAGWLAVLL